MLLVGGATPRTFAPSGKNPCTATGYECNYRDPSTGILVNNNIFFPPRVFDTPLKGFPSKFRNIGQLQNLEMIRLSGQ